MAQTAGIFNGTDLKVYVEGLPIAHATSCELSVTHSPREATTKDSAGDTARLPGKRDWSMSCDALYAEVYDDTEVTGFLELVAAIKAGTKLTLEFKTDVVGDQIYTGEAYLTDLNINAGTEENASYTASFAGTGAISMAAKTE
jgi:predicted secreted protein